MGIISIVMINFISYREIIKDDILNISKLTSANIYSQISNELTKPIFVSLTMANDSFVKDWLKSGENRQQEDIIKYLQGMRSKYRYDSTFLITYDTNEYFHYNGLHKIISASDEHDGWYYDFLKKNVVYDLDVDQDEADQNILTVFINCRIMDENDVILGVTGVGIKSYHVQQMLESFEDDYDLEAFLVDGEGLVQVHTNYKNILKKNIFSQPVYEKIDGKMQDSGENMRVFTYNENGGDEFIITQYIKDLNWYLIVRKDTSVLKNSFMNQMVYDLIIFAAVTFTVLLIVVGVIGKYQRSLEEQAHTDSLTSLLNRRGFDKKLKHLINNPPESEFSVFILDLDGFKDINDKYGHLQGDKVLVRVSSIFRDKLPENSIFARWGGDEFAGIVFMNREKSLHMLEEIRKILESDDQVREFNVTISVGIVVYSGIETEESMIRKADKAMYFSKSNGKNQINVF